MSTISPITREALQTLQGGIRSLNSLYRVLVLELVKELSVQQPLAYEILYLQTSSELPLY